MANKQDNRSVIKMAGIGGLLALPVLLIEFVIFFVFPGVFKSEAGETDRSADYSEAASDRAYNQRSDGTDGAGMEKDDTSSHNGSAADDSMGVVALDQSSEPPAETGTGAAGAAIADQSSEPPAETGNTADRPSDTAASGTNNADDDKAKAQTGDSAEGKEDSEKKEEKAKTYTAKDLGKTKKKDFTWFRSILYDGKKVKDVFSEGKVIREPDAVEGAWKAYMTDDPGKDYSSGVVRLMKADLHTEGEKVTLALLWGSMTFNDTGEVVDESGMHPEILTGKWTENRMDVKLRGEFMEVTLRQFFQADGKSYGSGTVLWQSGEQDVIGFKRP